MIYDDQRHVSLLEFPSIRNQLIVLNGWSKTWAMTGWRLGWSIWPDQLLGDIRKFALNGWSCVNAPAQFAGIAAIDGPQDDVEKMLRAFDRRRGIIVEHLNKLPGFSCSTPKGRFMRFQILLKPVGKRRSLRLNCWKRVALQLSGVLTLEHLGRVMCGFHMPIR